MKDRSELPDPVTAQAQISRPSSAMGTVAAWIGVGECRPMAERAWNDRRIERIRDEVDLPSIMVERFSCQKKLDPD